MSARLARQLTAAHVGHTQIDNAITAVDAPAHAQPILARLSTRVWPPVLTAGARRVHPLLRQFHAAGRRPYSWSVDESEYATDVLFANRDQRQAVYPAWTQPAMRHFSREDVLRFLGRRLQAPSDAEGRTLFTRRIEGVG